MGLTPRVFKAHEYQQIAIDFMLTTPRCALWAGMGLGKGELEGLRGRMA